MSKVHTIKVNNEEKEVQINHAYCIGYTGRDIESTKAHIKELADIGIPEPSEIPMLYPVRTSSLMQSGGMQVLGNQTSGETEIVLIFGDSDSEAYLTVGSDHTDRSLEEVDINKSKQVCDKPFAKKVWNLNDVIDHWDSIELKSEMFIDGNWEPYQSDKISKILPYEEIKNYLNKKGVSLVNSIFFSGTVPLLEGFKYGTKFKIMITDPVQNDEISLTYDVTNIEGR